MTDEEDKSSCLLIVADPPTQFDELAILQKKVSGLAVLLKKMLNGTGTLLDIGAHIGTIALRLANRDGRVTLQVAGPIQDYPPKVYAFIDLTHGHFESGSNHEPLQIQFLQKDFQLTDDQLRIIPFRLQPADWVPKGFHSSPP